MIAMRLLKNVVRWKEFCSDQKQSNKTELNEENGESRFMDTGLSTGLKPTFGLNNAKDGSDNLEVLPTSVRKNPPQGGFTTPTFRTPEH